MIDGFSVFILYMRCLRNRNSCGEIFLRLNYGIVM